MIYIYAYKPRSKSAKALSNILNYPLIKHEGSRFKSSPEKLVINWGAYEIKNAEAQKCKILNVPDKVSQAANKLSFFQAMESSKLTPPFTSEESKATDWIENGSLVVCRTALNSHSGRGIVLARSASELVHAPLYVQYKKKVDEYRVHVFKGQVIDVQRKARNLDIPDNAVNWAIRNHGNGFIFARENVGPDTILYYQKLLDSALTCMQIVELDFGAVDLIYNKKKDRVYVLEVNTAPGLEGTTLARYAQAFRGLKT